MKNLMPALLIPLCLTSCGGDRSFRPVVPVREPAPADAPFCRQQGWFQCHPWCFPDALKCDGTADCPNAEDEAQCDGDAPAPADAKTIKHTYDSAQD